MVLLDHTTTSKNVCYPASLWVWRLCPSLIPGVDYFFFTSDNDEKNNVDILQELEEQDPLALPCLDVAAHYFFLEKTTPKPA